MNPTENGTEENKTCSNLTQSMYETENAHSEKVIWLNSKHLS